VRELLCRPAAELAQLIRQGELSSPELVEASLRRIDEVDPQIRAFSHVAHESARQAAAEIAAGDPRPFAGVPIAIKDNRPVEGMPMTVCSDLFGSFRPCRESFLIGRLRAAGFVIVGKTAMPEMGILPTTESRRFGPTHNPWALDRTPGGSSGGSAAAVAAGMVPIAHGNDGGGSIRIPASVCGLFGIKPSRGRISQGPLMPDLAGLSTDGPIARTVADAALLLDVMAGNYPGDMYTQPPLAAGETFLRFAGREPGRLRIARSLQTVMPGAGPHPDCVAAYEEASALLASLGHEVEDVELPFRPEAIPAFETLWYSMATLAPIEAAQEEELLPLTRYLRGRGLALRAVDLLFAQAYLQAVSRSALSMLSSFDAILHPTLASPPVPVGYFDEVEPAENFERQKQFTPWTALYNLSGQPAVSLPLHWTAAGLPIGVMLAGRIGDEGTLISLSAQLEAARPWRDRHPASW
jgi:amidase